MKTHYLLHCQSAEAVEYPDYFSAEEYDPSAKVCSRHDTNQSDGEVP